MQHFLITMMFLFFTAPGWSQSAPTSPSIKEQRQAAANRPRQLILDNDGNEAVTMKTLTAADFLAQRTSGLAGTGLQTIYYCSNATFTLSTRPTKVWQPRNYRLSGRPDAFSVEELAAAGLDPLKLVAEFGRKHGIEVFSSIRVNDVHDHSTTADYGPPMFKHNAWKQAHLNWLLSDVKHRSKTGAWSAVNFLIPQVRDKFFAYVEEACRDYDIDGVNLDFFRHPVFFPSTFAGKKATSDERQAMTELMLRIRTMTDEVGRKRGRPILISMRLPDSVEYCHDIGLDLQNWLKSDLLDLLVVSGYFQLNDWQKSAALGKQYGVKVYASLDESRIKDEQGRKARSTSEAYRGRTAAARYAGLDGVMLFNFFDPKSSLWKELGNIDRLNQLDKHYFASVRGIVNSNGGNLPIAPYQKIETLNPANPRKLSPGKAATADIVLGQVNSQVKKIRLRFRSIPKGLTVKINGLQLTMQEDATESGWVEAILPHPTLAGKTTISVLSETAAEWLDVMVAEKQRW